MVRLSLKIRFPIPIKYPKQMDSLMEFLSSRGYSWVSKQSLANWRKVMIDVVPSKQYPVWILLGNRGEGKACITYYNIEEGEESSEKFVCDWSNYTPREVEFED